MPVLVAGASGAIGNRLVHRLVEAGRAAGDEHAHDSELNWQYEEVAMSPKKDAQKSTRSTTAINKKPKGFTDEELAAMKERAQELKAEARRGPRKAKADGERDVLAKIAAMQEPDRAMAKRLHA